MNTFAVVSGVASILGMILAAFAAYQAKRASTAAAEARGKVILKTLTDELEVSCLWAEQLLDLLNHSRFSEATLRVGDLTSTLSELRTRIRSQFGDGHANSLLTAQRQLQSIADAVDGDDQQTPSPKTDMVKTARRVVYKLREILGAVKAVIEHGVEA